jgi:TetR/AcrR family tetracycline transcriptional repressor
MARTANAPGLTRDAVLAAAARVLERDGLGGLTMRGVAAELGVQAPALYWHVDNKDALRLALYDHLMAGLVFAPGGVDWRDDLRRMAHDLRARLLSRRDLARLIPDGFFYAPRSMALLDTVLGVLLAAGLKPRDAFYAFTTAFSYVVRWCLGEAELRARPPEKRPGLDAAAKALLGDRSAFPHFARVAEAFREPGGLDEQFAFGIDSLIAGYERLIARTDPC